MIITLKILSAEGLLGKGGNTHINPFVRIRLGDQALRTKKKEKTTSPKWNETFTLCIPGGLNSQTELVLHVCSHDSLGLGEEFLGGISVFLEQYLEKNVQEPEWQQLQPREGKKDKVSGRIQFLVSLHEGSSSYPTLSPDLLPELSQEDKLPSSSAPLLSPTSAEKESKAESVEEKSLPLPAYRQLNLSLIQSQNSVLTPKLSPRSQLSTYSAPDLGDISPEEASTSVPISPRSTSSFLSYASPNSPEPRGRSRGVTDSQVARALSPSARKGFLSRKLSAGKMGTSHSAIPLDTPPIRQLHEAKAKTLGLPFPNFFENEESYAWTVRMNKEYGTLLLTKSAFSFCFGEESKKMVIIWTKDIKLVDLSELRKLVLVKLPNKIKYTFEVSEKALREKLYDQMKSFWDPNKKKSIRRSIMSESNDGFLSARRESGIESFSSTSSLHGSFTSRQSTAGDLHNSLQSYANSGFSQSVGNLHSLSPNTSFSQSPNNTHTSIIIPEPETFNYSDLPGNKDPMCNVIFDDVPSGVLMLNDPWFGIPDAATLGEQVAISSYPTSARGIFVVCWADSSDFTRTIHTSDGDVDIEIGKWELDHTRSFFGRTLNFTRKSRLATTRITQTQRLRPLWVAEEKVGTEPGAGAGVGAGAGTSAATSAGNTTPGTENSEVKGSSDSLNSPATSTNASGAKVKDWLFETSNKMEGIPFADQFTVESRWLVISEDGGRRTTLKVHVFVEFRQNLSFAAKAAKSKINSVSVDGISEFVKNYLSLLSTRISPLPTTPHPHTITTSSSGAIPILDTDNKKMENQPKAEVKKEKGFFEFSFFLPFTIFPTTAAEVRNNIYTALIVFNLIMLILVAHFYSSQGSLLEQLDQMQSIHSGVLKEREQVMQSISLSQDSVSSLYSLVDEMKKKLTLFQQAVLLKRLNL